MQKQSYSSIKNFFKQIKFDHLFKPSNTYYYLVYFYIIVAFLKLLLLIVDKEPDFSSIMKYVDGGIILIATLAALTFTYAAASAYPEKRDIINSGKYFIKSLLYFFGGIIFSIGFHDVWNHPSKFFTSSGILLVVSQITDLIILWSGIIMLLLSAFFLVLGIRNLSKSLENRTYADDDFD